MERRQPLPLRRGAICLLLAMRCTATTAAAAVEACDSRGASTAGSVLLQKGVTHTRLPPDAAEVAESAQQKPEHHHVEDMKVPVVSPSSQPAVALVQEKVAIGKAVPIASPPSRPPVSLIAAIQAASASGKAVQETLEGGSGEAVQETLKAAPSLSDMSHMDHESHMDHMDHKEAVPSTSEKSQISKEASKEVIHTADWQRHQVIHSALIGPAGGHVHAADPGMIDKVAVGGLDFVATGGRVDYCKSWLGEKGFLCEFGAIFLSLLVCTPIFALSVAAFWGIVTGLKSINQ